LFTKIRCNKKKKTKWRWYEVL